MAFSFARFQSLQFIFDPNFLYFFRFTRYFLEVFLIFHFIRQVSSFVQVFFAFMIFLRYLQSLYESYQASKLILFALRWEFSFLISWYYDNLKDLFLLLEKLLLVKRSDNCTIIIFHKYPAFFMVDFVWVYQKDDHDIFFILKQQFLVQKPFPLSIFIEDLLQPPSLNYLQIRVRRQNFFIPCSYQQFFSYVILSL